ncbi:hypothetical protein GOODEAATRI_021631 [Goodea atripinnis]|uniref:Uncharacterized protein n=1 Tax=Goodea atripinnis TaxID=208336 RepID=A0ABV0NM49_9TELE
MVCIIVAVPLKLIRLQWSCQAELVSLSSPHLQCFSEWLRLRAVAVLGGPADPRWLSDRKPLAARLQKPLKTSQSNSILPIQSLTLAAIVPILGVVIMLLVLFMPRSSASSLYPTFSRPQNHWVPFRPNLGFSY